MAYHPSMVVIRRTFYCKPGHAGRAIEVFKRVVQITAERDPNVTAQRLYTDLSGRTDRVVIETETETLINPRELSKPIHGHPDAAGLFGQLLDHLDHAEGEFWVLEAVS